MNLTNASFLCLDIGTYGVRGFAHQIRNAKIVNSAMHFVKNSNTLYALNAVIDELEQRLNTHFDSTFVTGNFGTANFSTVSNTFSWDGEHKISQLDLRHQIAKINPPSGFYAMHIVPVFYGTPNERNIKHTPIGHTSNQLKSIFSVISYEEEKTKYISNIMSRTYTIIWIFRPVFFAKCDIQTRK